MSSLTTKELASKLGSVKKLQASEAAAEGFHSQGQPLSYLVVLDFEATCWDTKTRAPGRNEIIEFPAVFLDVKNGSIIHEFQRYVKPTENPTLSKFCTDLTGITQDQVDASHSLPQSLTDFESWVNGQLKLVDAEFYDHANYKHRTFVHNGCDANKRSNEPGIAGFVTWSDWDLGQCLQSECSRKRIRKSREFNSWIDLRHFYRNFYKRNPTCLRDALENVGLKFKGREHSGIADAKNTAALAALMMADGCVLKITSNIESNGRRVHSVPPASSVSAVLDRVRRDKEACAKRVIGPPTTTEQATKRPRSDHDQHV